ncbi:hypothetical protein AC579_5567 [Pseudocercospora musae]|uniref:DNA polymerase delta subunit 3 n=1 Tax=Pseudocercospora musae TaxID=113226 RepID=A0A139I0F7_9PEZI|nr:hypothetical protein AC579_5567 [Pseudocercospora musae]
MSQDYNEYLAVNVLNEQQYVTYRNLSRALKVHSNAAKQMLYEFHRKQNSKKPGSLHATYLIAGTKHSRSQPLSSTKTHAEGVHSQQWNDHDGDVPMPMPMNSSPPMPSSSFHQPDVEHSGSTRDVVPAKVLMLVREEHLEKARAQFESITGIHIYSLQPNGLSDFQLLTDRNRSVLSDYASEDSLKEWKQYGVIQNANVKRRTRQNAPPISPPAASAKKPEPATAKPVAAPPQPAREDSQDAKTSTTSAPAETAVSSTTKNGVTSKKEGGLFKAFAKGAAKPKKPDSQRSSAAPSPPAEDAPMTGFSDDDDDNDDVATFAEPEETTEPSGPSRKDRKAELEAMMNQEDESMDDAPEPADERAPEDESQHDDGAIDKKAAKEEAPKETITVENGRRRGRRRVMKKKTVKDEEGYLVTKEEPVWEEFSEEEPAPKKAKVSPPAPSSKAGEKKTAKKGQGNIMSFFGKR